MSSVPPPSAEPPPARSARAAAISAGLLAAKAKGKRIGRPLSEREPQIEELLTAGWPADRVRRHLRVGSGTVQRVRNRMKTGG